METGDPQNGEVKIEDLKRGVELDDQKHGSRDAWPHGFCTFTKLLV